MGHKSILIALNLIITPRGLQGCGDFPHYWLVDIDSPGGGLEIFEQFAINLNSEQFILSHRQRLDQLQIQRKFLTLPVSMHLQIDLVLAGLPRKGFAILIERVFEIEIRHGTCGGYPACGKTSLDLDLDFADPSIDIEI